MEESRKVPFLKSQEICRIFLYAFPFMLSSKQGAMYYNICQLSLESALSGKQKSIVRVCYILFRNFGKNLSFNTLEMYYYIFIQKLQKSSAPRPSTSGSWGFPSDPHSPTVSTTRRLEFHSQISALAPLYEYLTYGMYAISSITNILPLHYHRNKKNFLSKLCFCPPSPQKNQNLDTTHCT